MRVCVVTTSYPRHPGDVAGSFVADAVARLRAAGVGVEVVSPAVVRDFGIAYGGGIPNNLREAPWRVALVPLFLAGLRRAAARAARAADVVHAHWIPSGAIAATLGRPYVLQVWGSDVELARRVPVLARRALRRARLVIAPSRALAGAVLALGARDVRVIPNGVDVPPPGAPPADPPHVLFAGRLSAEKGVAEFAAATAGLPRVVVGDGPLRELLPDTVGFVPPSGVGAYYDRAAVVAVPSWREGFGVVCREAMAHGRPVVATAVGGLLDVVEDGVNGLLVPPRDAVALRGAIERLLGDAELRRLLGDAARAHVAERLSWDAYVERTLAAYTDALR